MKKILLAVLIITIAACSVKAQNPVSWSYAAKKISDKSYEVRLTATIQKGWHLYSQSQPDDAIAIPTEIKFNSNPLTLIDGKIKEIGKMEKFHDKSLDVSANQYSNKVEFVQLVKLKGKVKTKITGTVEFQTCDDKKCLPPKKENFTIDLK